MCFGPVELRVFVIISDLCIGQRSRTKSPRRHRGAVHAAQRDQYGPDHRQGGAHCRAEGHDEADCRATRLLSARQGSGGAQRAERGRLESTGTIFMVLRALGWHS